MTHVNGISDANTIVEQFVCHFSRACSYNTVSGAAKLKDAKRPHYVGAATDNSFHFDAELVETVINKMKLGKAAGLDGLTGEHLHYCNSVLPCVLSKLFNCMMAIGRVSRTRCRY